MPSGSRSAVTIADGPPARSRRSTSTGRRPPTTQTRRAELADLLDDARAAGVPDDDLALVDLLLRSPSVDDVAAALEVTTRTVRNRRARVAAKLRDVALAA
ncbi:MAG: hypothetical protein R2705_21195 [Ilumatobacteraceae bacterium]